MSLDFCEIPTELWIAIWLASILVGASLGHVMTLLFPKASDRLSSSMVQEFAGGCLIPVLFAFASGFIVARLMPEDPCGGANTPDVLFVPLEVIPLIAISAVGLFWFKAWRK